MADKPVTPEAVALDLAITIQGAPSESSDRNPMRRENFRAYYLDLYSECLVAARGSRKAGGYSGL